MKRSVLGRPGSDVLSQVLGLSTIGAGEFNGRVRDGIGFRPPAIATRPAKDRKWNANHRRPPYHHSGTPIMAFRQAGQRHPQGLLGIEDERRSSSHERLVPVSSTHCCAYTPGLLTWWSSTALKGELVSRWVSRLDAFSDYPVRT